MYRYNHIKRFDFIYHVMVGSTREIPLFNVNDDKDKYSYYVKGIKRIWLQGY